MSAMKTAGVGGPAQGLPKLRLLPDMPVADGYDDIKDLLKFGKYSRLLAGAALNTPEPFTIGIYGDWGSGKTSLMRMMKELIDKEPNCVGVWFNAWRYEKEEHLIVPLLATVVEAVEKFIEDSKDLVEETKEAAKSLLKALRSIVYGVSIKGKVKVPGVAEAEISLAGDKAIDRYAQLQKLATDQFMEQSLYFNSFKKLDELGHNENQPRLVIFIDDLDRCFPDRAISLLENIKLVLNQSNISFVLGIAPKVILEYLKVKYEKEFQIDSDHYRNYLDKMVQLQFPVPEAKDNISEFAMGLLNRKDIFKENIIAEDEKKALADICGPACEDNPRQIIRFLNRLLILLSVLETEGNKDKVKLIQLAIENALRMRWENLLHELLENREVVLKGKSKDGTN